MAGYRVSGIDNTAGRRLDHDQTSHTHQDVFIPEPLVHAVGNGLKAVFTGDDFLVCLKHVFKADIEFRSILSRKRAAFGILSECAAAKGDGDAFPVFGFKVFPGVSNGRFKVVGNTGANDKLLRCCAECIKRLDIAAFNGLKLPVYFGLKVIIIH